MPHQIENLDEFDEPAVYTLRVSGCLEPEWAEWFDGLVLSLEPEADGSATMLHCVVRDQAALRGLLTRIWNLNLTLLSAVRASAHDRQKQGIQIPGAGEP